MKGQGYRLKELFVRTPPEVLAKHALIMEKRFGGRWSARHIAKEFDMSVNVVHRILYRYKAPKTERNVIFIITSKV